MTGDKKISELRLLTDLGLEDFFAIVPLDGSETYKTTLAAIKAAIANNDTDYGSEVFFGMGAPVDSLGRTIDIYFDLVEYSIYQKNSAGNWNKKVLLEKKSFELAFTSTNGQTTYTNVTLNNGTVKEIFIDGLRNPVGYTVAGNTITFSTPLNNGCKVKIIFA